ncbi:TPA: FeS-binding protein [bacterium]|nr:FeS-binding protein [bacterium]
MIIKARLVFPEELIKEPIIYHLGKNFDIVYNILSANVDAKSGWVVLELDGENDQIDKAINWLSEKDIEVEIK